MTHKRLLVLIGVAMVAFDIAILALDKRMQSTGGPGIIGLEFAGSKTRVAQIMTDWGTKGRDAARLSLWIDFGFLLSYGAFFTLAGLASADLARRRGWRRLTAAGVVLPFFAMIAATFDASENVALLLALAGHGGSFAPPFATVCASAKFALIAIAITYVLWVLAWRLWQRQPIRRIGPSDGI
jgi:hypothetical protein